MCTVNSKAFGSTRRVFEPELVFPEERTLFIAAEAATGIKGVAE